VRAFTTLLASAATAALFAAPAQAASVSPSFFGVMANGPLNAPGVDLINEGAVMKANGVGTIRLPVQWPTLQPYASFEQIPASAHQYFTNVGGIPTDFSATDAQIGAAARNNLDVTALVVRAPAWAALNPNETFSAPRDPATYGRFLTTLIGRYGAKGTFWAANPSLPKRPLRNFQIWNEPSLNRYFPVKSWAPAYAKLLRASYKAIKAADPGATVITAGLPNFSWRDYATLFKAGMKARGYFDAIAVHPFTGTADGSVKILGYVRAVLDANGARTAPLWVTEISWPSGRGKADANQNWVTTEAGEALKVDQVYRAYAKSAKRLKLARAYWYNWVSSDSGNQDAFEYAGLRRVGQDGSFESKPALGAYRKVAQALTR
jgi:Glycosyl hydrolase catalytic core